MPKFALETVAEQICDADNRAKLTLQNEKFVKTEIFLPENLQNTKTRRNFAPA